VRKEHRFSRRDFIYLGLGGVLLGGGLPLARAISQQPQQRARPLTPTPSNTLGPFYRAGAPRKERLIEPGASGSPLLVSGRVIDTEGRVLSDAKVEVFHADASGEYDMRGFNCRGEIPVGRSGDYQYETIIPAGYGGRAQHIHYVISAPGHKRLVTQLYFETDPKFEGNPDRNYTRDNLVWHRELIRPVRTVNKDQTTYASVLFDICLETA
jgi:protocatechuate 3,4-dioxygenase beta subunit